MQIFFEKEKLDPGVGLDTSQVQLSSKKFGRNELTPPDKTPWWKELLSKFEDPTIIILLIAAFLSLGVTLIQFQMQGGGEHASFFEPIGIFIAVGLATLVAFFSERKSAKEFELLNKVKEDIRVKVFRNGQLDEISITELVVGDILKITLGDKIPADGILLEASNLKIEESMMTGESMPARKTACEKDMIQLDDPQTLESLNQLGNPFFAARGTMVADGSGLMCVTAVGDKTQMGKIASALTDDPYRNETPLTAKLSVLARQISAAGVSGALLIFTVMSVQALVDAEELTKVLQSQQGASVGLLAAAAVCGFLSVRFLLRPFFRSMDLELKSLFLRILCWVPMTAVSLALLVGISGVAGFLGNGMTAASIELLDHVLLSFIVAVTIIVVAVPEGLPMMVTVSLALNMMKMAKENCLVRKLVASETIGSATVICTDKTGTLTQNRMVPVWGVLGEKVFDKDALLAELPKCANWESIVCGIALNSTADLHVETEKDGTPKILGIGNPTECAFLKFLNQAGISYSQIRSELPLTGRLEHNSQRKMSVVSVQKDGKRITYAKGAPERVFARCAQILIDGKTEPIAPHMAFLNQKIDEAASRSLRVLAFCETEEDWTDETVLENAENAPNGTLVGLLGIADPMRPEVPAAVAQCHKAGIVVKMVTGDSLPTARAIALESGIYSGSKEELVLTSEEFNQIPDDELPEKAKKLRVLARSTPADKLRLVKALHHDGEVVAMTGDGTNDAPALKFADVGLSMGQTGTEVAKEASDIVLLNDNFTNIVTGVSWGRTLFQNIQRFLQFQLSVNVVALLCAVIGPCFGLPLPLTVTQLLWINIIMDTLAAIAYSTQPPRPKVLEQPPISRNASIVSLEMMLNVLFVGIFQTAMLFAALYGNWFALEKDLVNDVASKPAAEKVLQDKQRGAIASSMNGFVKSIDDTTSIIEPPFEFVKDWYDESRNSENLSKGGSGNYNVAQLTIFFTMLIMFQFWHKFNCRSLSGRESAFAGLLKCRGFLSIILFITATQVLLVQVPQIGAFFRTVPLTLGQWIAITIVTSSVLVVGWVARKISQCFGG
ncbi:MAG: cation-translocating P-type ATPase [Thermoguttaceae bacterium]|nr:cation-translocating P-type ATPase [Thermoguttaceae bacterium]